jgi:hypothetical protein
MADSRFLLPPVPCPLSRRFLRLGRFQCQQQRPCRNRLSRLNMNFGDFAGRRAGNLQRRLARLQFDDALVLGDDVALLDEQL